MIVPEYWAEARRHERTRERQVTVRRFGWSDESQEAAQRHAEERVEAAFRRVLQGEELPRREPKVPYNGADGVPIREQIVERHGETVITRNSYGARCLNTPDVLFADVDFRREAAIGPIVLMFAVLVAGAVAAKIVAGFGTGPLLGLIVVAGIASAPLATGLLRLTTALRGGQEALALRRIHRFAAAHPDWHLRVYRTPAGFRVLAMHKTFEPRGPEAAGCFDALRVDPVYARMCKVQNCFRARVSPKPWRVGVPHHMKPRPGVWPVNPERLPDRQRWIDGYEARARGYASCRFVEQLGPASMTDARARAVCALHDRLCRSDSGDPIA